MGVARRTVYFTASRRILGSKSFGYFRERWRRRYLAPSLGWLQLERLGVTRWAAYVTSGCDGLGGGPSGHFRQGWRQRHLASSLGIADAASNARENCCVGDRSGQAR